MLHKQIWKILKTSYKDIVDLVMTLVMFGVGIYGSFFAEVNDLGYIFFGAYVVWLNYRKGWWMEAANKYVTKIKYRKILKLPIEEYYKERIK